MVDDSLVWAERLARVATTWRTAGRPVAELFHDLGIPVDAWGEVRRAVEEVLLRSPSLIDDWQGFCDDQRGTPAPYLRGLETGFVEPDGQHLDVTTHPTRSAACADFVIRKAAWVLQQQRVRG